MPQESTFTAEAGLAICKELEDGTSLLETCRKLNIKESTVRSWTRVHPDFAADYARAREDGDDIEFERLQELQAETPPIVEGKVDQGWVQWQKNRVETAKWGLARKRPKKFGDKMDLNHSGSIASTLSDEELNSKLAALGVDVSKGA